MATHAHITDTTARKTHRCATRTPLLAAVARFLAAHAAILNIEARNVSPRDEVEATTKAWNKAVVALCPLAPKNVAELAAKAFALAIVIRTNVGDITAPDHFEESAQLHDRLALAFARDAMAMNARVS